MPSSRCGAAKLLKRMERKPEPVRRRQRLQGNAAAGSGVDIVDEDARGRSRRVDAREIGRTLEKLAFGGRRVTTFTTSTAKKPRSDGVQADRSRAPPALNDLTSSVRCVRRRTQEADSARANLVDGAVGHGRAGVAEPLRTGCAGASITLSAGIAPGYSLGDEAWLPRAAGRARGTAGAGAERPCRRLARPAPKPAVPSVLFTFGMALMIVFLVLAAQFSFVHPFVIMLTVPLAVLGALLRPVAVRVDAKPLQPDRHHHADRSRGEERHSHSRILQEPVARPGPQHRRGAIRESGGPYVCARS